MIRLITIASVLLFSARLLCQEFSDSGLIREDLLSTSFSGESGANAIVLYDSTSARMDWNGGFRVAFSRLVRIKILKPSGFSWSYVQIVLSGGDKLLQVEASTYNLENNHIVESRVPEKQIYSERSDPYHRTVRFTFPNVREGSVVEYRYSILQQDIWEFHSMRFQRVVPVRYLVYHAAIPAYFNYSVYYTRNELIGFQQQVKPGRYNGHATDIRYFRWEGRNIPPFITEPLIPEGEQTLAGVDFTLSSVNYPGAQSFLASPSYEALTEEFLDRSPVGKQLGDPLLFNGQVSLICEGIRDPLKKMKTVYAWVQQHMQWNGYDQLWPDRSLIRAKKEGTGTSAEINLILLNMLRTAGIQADPVVLNTRSQGPVITRAAVVSRLNYLLCCVTLDGKDYLLDATDKFRPPGLLPYKCLNDKGWVLSKTNGRWVNLSGEEKHDVRAFFDLQMESDFRLRGKVYLTFSSLDAASMRKALANEGTASVVNIPVTGDFEIANPVFIYPDSLHLPFRIEADVFSEKWVQSGTNILFFKPLITLFNPIDLSWIQETRLYPMDFGCPRTLSVKGRISLPKGVVVEELPGPLQIRLPGKSDYFVSGVAHTDEQISYTADLNLGSFLTVEEYPGLRAFLLQVHGKFNEMAVCKIQ